VTTYRIDGARSSVTAAVRPPMGLPTVEASAEGLVEVIPSAIDDLAATAPRTVGPGELAGSLQLSLDHQPSVAIDLALAAADTTAELSLGPDGELVLRGQRSAPAEAFGIVGPPLVNPTLLISWRLVLDPT
jgi:hypothetical protein